MSAAVISALATAIPAILTAIFAVIKALSAKNTANATSTQLQMHVRNLPPGHDTTEYKATD